MQYSRNAPEIDHIFPRSILRDRGVDEELINSFANFWILAAGKNRNKSNRHPKEYFDDVGAVDLETSSYRSREARLSAIHYVRARAEGGDDQAHQRRHSAVPKLF